MPAPLSVIIPTLNAEAALRESLPGVMEGVAAGLVREVIVSDGGSRDRTQELAEATGAHLVDGTAGRGAQLKRGAEAARGEWFLFMHADTHLPPGWAEVAQAAMTNPAQAHVFSLSFRAKGAAPALVAGWANLRTRLLGLPFGDQGLLIARTLLNNVGGYPDLPLMEDVAIARSLHGRINLLAEQASTAADRYESQGWIRRGARNLSLQASYFLGTSPDELARRYASASSPDSDPSGSLN